MPTYEYECPDCNHAFEEFQSITAKPIKLCPECGKRRVVRLIGTGSGVIFKGSGFYGTDYRSDSYKKAAKADKDSGSAKSTDASSKSTTDKPATTPSESKPEPKPSSKKSGTDKS